MYEILPHLFLSNYEEFKLSPFNYFVINCTRDIPMHFREGIRIPMDDNINDIKSNLVRVIDIIDKKVSNNCDVIVFSVKGQRRSATMVIGYVMHKMNLDVDRAIRFVKSKKPDIETEFREALEEYIIKKI